MDRAPPAWSDEADAAFGLPPESDASVELPSKPFPKQSKPTYSIPFIHGKVYELGSPQELEYRQNYFITEILKLDKEIDETPGGREQLLRMSEHFTSVPIQIMEDFIQQWPNMMRNRVNKRSTIAEQILENEQISIPQAKVLAQIAIPITGNTDPVKIKEILESTKTDKWKKYL